ncbi:unnamed protein product [Acanthoscelides obtectus]|jgi:hypothetical protein
MLRN